MTNLNTKIEWTDCTWSPTVGCTKVSAGCDNCYAETITERFHGKGSFAEVKLHHNRLNAPLHWRKPRRVFVNSMSDLFHDAVPDEFIATVWAVMATTPQHTYQVLTKRHGRMRSLLSSLRFINEVCSFIEVWAEEDDANLLDFELTWPIPHIWLGVSVEDQKRAKLRIPALLETAAAVRFLSCEPLLGSVDLDDVAGLSTLEPDWAGSPYPGAGTGARHPLLDWVIVGGESGAHARPMHPAWAQSLRNQCIRADVPFFFKQWGEFIPNPSIVEMDSKRHRYIEVEHGTNNLLDVGMWRVGKKSAGRELDGRTWDEFPITPDGHAL